jgi:hypothetical protein
MLLIVMVHTSILISTADSFSPIVITIKDISIRSETSCFFSKKHEQQKKDHGNQDGPKDEEERDTIRVRIWKALSSSYGEELSMRQLGSIVGERRIGDIKSHLVHVEKQAKTIGNKSQEWKQRRGIEERTKKIKIVKRRKANGMIYVKLV